MSARPAVGTARPLAPDFIAAIERRAESELHTHGRKSNSSPGVEVGGLAASFRLWKRIQWPALEGRGAEGRAAPAYRARQVRTGNARSDPQVRRLTAAFWTFLHLRAGSTRPVTAPCQPGTPQPPGRACPAPAPELLRRASLDAGRSRSGAWLVVPAATLLDPGSHPAVTCCPRRPKQGG